MGGSWLTPSRHAEMKSHPKRVTSIFPRRNVSIVNPSSSLTPVNLSRAASSIGSYRVYGAAKLSRAISNKPSPLILCMYAAILLGKLNLSFDFGSKKMSASSIHSPSFGLVSRTVINGCKLLSARSLISKASSGLMLFRILTKLGCTWP